MKGRNELWIHSE
jgi:hypothetical protein